MQRHLPAGTVTFLFSDVEGSTRLLHALGAEGYAEALAEHRRVLRDAFNAYGGVEVDTQGDAFFVAFPTASRAVRAATDALTGLAAGPIRVRIGIHTGTPHLAEEGYVGVDVHRAARIAACGHGGQVLVSASTAALLEADILRDLGEHRLKDLSAPERIYQLGDREFPPLKSLHQTNLPVPATPFLGREREVSEVTALLGREDVRLVTLTGPGGSGKTRLALQSAGAAADAFDGGVWWAPLAALRDPALVVEVAAHAVGAESDLVEHIGDKRLLLVLDNFEHVVAAAPDVAHLLERCPRLTVLVTSREVLRLDGEWEYGVDPLHAAEAVALFETRARAKRRDFVANGEVREICARLDNLPLAIELAAARVKVLSTRALLDRLEQRLPVLTGGTRDAPERQRTLRATIEWSHDLLSPEEQTLFRRLAVFAGGATLETIETVCEADLDLLASLLDKNLVRHTEDRYWMLETIREYAAQHLEESGESEELGRRHDEHFLAFAEEAEPNLRGTRHLHISVRLAPKDWLDRLESEHDNLRAALDRLESSGEGELALRLAAALWRFWDERAYLAEGRRRLECALSADPRPTATRANGLNGAADMALNAGDAATAMLRAEEAFVLHEKLEDAWGAAESVLLLGHAAADHGDLATAQQRFEESARRFRELGDEHNTLLATRLLAWTYNDMGDRERARALHEENLRRARALSNDPIAATTLGALASYAVDEGRLDDAVSMATESLSMYRDLGNRHGVAIEVCRCAGACALKGQARTAAQLLSSSEVLHEEIGASVRPWLAAENERTLGAIRSQLDEAAFAEAWEQGRMLTADEAVAVALESLGGG